MEHQHTNTNSHNYDKQTLVPILDVCLPLPLLHTNQTNQSAKQSTFQMPKWDNLQPEESRLRLVEWFSL